MSVTRSCTTGTSSSACARKGARFVEELDEIPPGSVTIFSAHGVASAVEEAATQRGLPVIDATCPLVSKVHSEGQRYANQGREIILIGHAGHPEIEGTMGRISGRSISFPSPTRSRARGRGPDKAVVHHPDDVERRRHPRGHRCLEGAVPDDRRAGHQGHLLRDAKPSARGARTGRASSTSCSSSAPRTARTRTACAKSPRNMACRAYLIEDAARSTALGRGREAVGITAGASAPAELVQDLIDRLRELGEVEVDGAAGRHRKCPLPHADRVG